MILSLREAHAAGAPLVSPVAHDALSARLIERAGFPAFNIGGSSLLAARFGLPDLGIAALGEMVDAMRPVIEAVRIPALVDADDGYGGIMSVVNTTVALHRVGAAGLLLEDQDRGAKQPGDSAARGVTPLDLFLHKLESCLSARPDPGMVVIARTDALGTDGLDEALRRGEAALRRGADGVFVAGLRTPDQFERVGAAFRGRWNVAAHFESPQTEELTPQVLHGLGFSQVVYPAALVMRIARTIETALARLQELSQGTRAVLAAAPDELSPTAFRDAVAMTRWQEVEASPTQLDGGTRKPA